MKRFLVGVAVLAATITAAAVAFAASAAPPTQNISLQATWSADTATSGTVAITWSGIPGSVSDGFVVLSNTGDLDTSGWFPGVLSWPCPSNSCMSETGGAVDWLATVHGGSSGTFSFTWPVPDGGRWWVEIWLYGHVGETSWNSVSNIVQLDATGAKPAPTPPPQPATTIGGTTPAPTPAPAPVAEPVTFQKGTAVTVTHADGSSSTTPPATLRNGDVLASAKAPVTLTAGNDVIVLDRRSKLAYRATGGLASAFQSGGWQLKSGQAWFSWNSATASWIEGPHGLAAGSAGTGATTFTLSTSGGADVIRCITGRLRYVVLASNPLKGPSVSLRAGQQVRGGAKKLGKPARFTLPKNPFWPAG